MSKTLNLSKLREGCERFGLWLEASVAIMEMCTSCRKNVGTVNEVDSAMTNISK